MIKLKALQGFKSVNFNKEEILNHLNYFLFEKTGETGEIGVYNKFENFEDFLKNLLIQRNCRDMKKFYYENLKLISIIHNVTEYL